MPFCPECRDEYVEGATSCPDCECGLVADLSAVPAVPAVPRQEAAVVEDRTPAAVAATLPDDRMAEAAVAALQALSIPARRGEASDQGVSVEVPEEFHARASAALRRLVAEPVEEVSDEDLQRVEAPLSALRREGAPAVESLIRVLVRGSGEAVLQAAFRLVKLDGEALDALRGALVEAVSADSDGIRGAAVRALVHHGRTEIPAGLGDLTGDAVAGVRQRAVRTLAALGSTGGLPFVIRLLRDEDGDVREEAADALWEMTGGRIDLDFEEDPELVEEAIRLLEERYGG